ncbi:hypothetical protein DZA55_03475 [Xanthomonas oryzae pv. oryzae]|nr:hypothetical protein DZA55_03475 [Xanthomonas oryzae pv. oryzae]
MPPHSEQIVSRICGALFRGSLDLATMFSTARTRGAITLTSSFIVINLHVFAVTISFRKHILISIDFFVDS